MSNFLEKLCCSIHNLNCVAINLSQTAEDDNLILCAKCLADKMSFISSVILINDALLLMNEMKHKQYQAKKSSIEESLYKFQTSIEKIQTYIDWLINSLNKMLTQLNQEVEKYQKELNSMSEPKIENLEKQDLMLLKHLQSNNDLSIQTNQDEFYEFIKVVQIQLENLKTGDNLEEIINYFQEIQKQEQIKDKSVAQRIETKSEEDTPAIRFKCNKHGKEIIVFSLDPEAQGERMLCVECIPKFKYEMSTLEEANQIWIIHQEEVYDSNSSFIRQRKQQWKSIQEIIIENHQQKQKLQQELLALLQNKVDKLGKEFQELELNKTKKQLMGFEKLNEIQETINLLLQKDRMSQVKQQQSQLKIDDILYQGEILKKLSEISKIDISFKKQLSIQFDQSYQTDLKKLFIEQMSDALNPELDLSIFTVIIPLIQNLIFQELIKICQKTIEKGNLYLKQLKKLDFEDQSQKQQLDIDGYQQLLRKFETEYKKKLQRKDNIDIAIQTNSKQLDFQQAQPIYTKFNQSFSDTLKHSRIKISADRKTAQTYYSWLPGGWYLCLCDQPIPKNGTVVVDFKSYQIQGILAGICLKDNYNRDYTSSSGFGKGCYFLSGGGYVYSHHDQSKSGYQKEGFEFYQNDIIRMEVNVEQKQISWINKAKNHIYTLDIQTTSDLYFCFQIFVDNKIELV